MSWGKWEAAAEHGPGALAWKVGCFIVPLVVVVAVVAGTLHFIGNPFRQAQRVIDKTIDADNVLYNYEWFKQRNQDIVSLDAKIADAERSVTTFKEEVGPRSDWKREDREECSRLSSVALGLRQQRNDLTAEYNARSQMANRSIFKTGDLPETISIR